MATKTKSTRAKKPASATKKVDERATTQTAKWQRRLAVARKNQERVFKDAKKNYEVYYGIIPQAEKPEADWKSNVFLPLLPGKARDAKAKLSIIDPKFRATPVDAFVLNPETDELEYDQDALMAAIKASKKLNKEYSNYTGTGKLAPQVAVDYSETDAIVAGWGLAFAPVEVYSKVYNTYDPLVDGQGNSSAYVDKGNKKTTKILRIGTSLDALDIFKVFISDKAKSFEQSPWLMIEREATYSDLEKENADIGERIYDLPVSLKKAKGTAATNEYSAVREQALGFAPDGHDKEDETVDKFTVYDCYDQETSEFFSFIVASIDEATNGWYKSRDIPNPYNHGMIPVIPFYVKRRPQSPWGESFFAISRDLQYAYNNSFNEFRDNQKVSGESMVLEDVNAKVPGASYDIGPGHSVKYDSLNGEKPETWKLPDPNPNTFGTVMTMIEKNAESGTMAQYNSGQVDSSMDKTAGTRGGIAMLMEAANDRLSEMYRNLKISLLRYGHIALSNAQQYQNYIEVLNTPDLNARAQRDIKAGNVVKADYITPSDLQHLFDVTIDEESLLPMTKTERRQVLKEFIDSMIALQASSIKQAETFDTPEDIMRLDWDDIGKAMGESYSQLDAPAFIKPSWTREQMAQKKVEDAAVDQHAKDGASKIAQDNNPDADVQQSNGQIQVERQKREMFTVDKMPADVQNAVIQSYGYPPSQLLAEDAKAQLAGFESTQLDTQVKKQMIDAASSGKLDPEQLSKFIKK